MIARLTFTLLFAGLTHGSVKNVKDIAHCNYYCDKNGFEEYCEDKHCTHTTEILKTEWIKNCLICEEESKHQLESLLSFTVTLNKFAIMLTENFLDFMMDNPIDLAENWRQCKRNVPPIEGEVPNSMNWTEKGAVTAVKDQQKCISSWAFSTVGVMEAYRVIKRNETLTALSAQNLIDCTRDLGNDGCYGGDVIKAFEYIKKHGINTEFDYPYEPKQGPNNCRFKENNSITDLAQDFHCTAEGDEEQLKAIVSKYGPVAVFVDARRWNFRFYNSGIYYDRKCCHYKHCLNHAMLLVGYGTDQGIDYWLLKNSWGESWGEQGYMRIARNLNNTCGVATAGLFLV